MNGQYLKNLPTKTVMKYAKPFFLNAELDISDSRKYESVIENARKRVNTILEMIDHSTPFYTELEFTDDDIKLLKNETSQKVLNFISERLSLQPSWTEAKIKSLVNETGESTEVKGKDLYSPLRLSLFGSPNGPDIPLLIDILGVPESTNRLKQHL